MILFTRNFLRKSKTFAVPFTNLIQNFIKNYLEKESEAIYVRCKKGLSTFWHFSQKQISDQLHLKFLAFPKMHHYYILHKFKIFVKPSPKGTVYQF